MQNLMACFPPLSNWLIILTRASISSVRTVLFLSRQACCNLRCSRARVNLMRICKLLWIVSSVNRAGRAGFLIL